MRKKSERQRWVQIYLLNEPSSEDRAKTAFNELLAIVHAFAKVRRVVRIEPGTYHKTIVVLARRA